MNTEETKLHLRSLLLAEVTISHFAEETLISFNGLSELNQLIKQILDKKISIDAHILNKIEENPKAKDVLKHYSYVQRKKMDKIFPTINGFITARAISIHDNIKGSIDFEDLEEKLQNKISKFIQIQKDYYEEHLDLLDEEEEQKPAKTNSTLKFNVDKKKTFFTKMAHKIYNSDFLISKEIPFPLFVNELCNIYGIPKFQNLSSIISNIKKEKNPFCEITEEDDNF